MTKPRCTQISLEDTPYYHCITRCVRRAFLCGKDNYSGQDFNHRRQWLIDRIKLEARVFAIDLCAYAIMSNHYHLVLRVDRERAQAWSDDEVIKRWCTLFRGPLLVQGYLAGEMLSAVERETVHSIAKVWRQRLTSISWFMRCLNECIARQANREDDCSGRFWEGRFKSQALLDTRALLSCMAYVDLNPVRAGVAEDLAGSNFTSIQERLRDVAEHHSRGKPRQVEDEDPKVPALLPFAEETSRDTKITALPFSLRGYIDLVDWTGRTVRADKQGAIPGPTPRALDDLHLNQEQWLALSLSIPRKAPQVIGHPHAVQRYNHVTGRSWSSGLPLLKKLYQVA